LSYSGGDYSFSIPHLKFVIFHLFVHDVRMLSGTSAVGEMADETCQMRNGK